MYALPWTSHLRLRNLPSHQSNLQRKFRVLPARVRGRILHGGHVPPDALLRELEGKVREEHCQDDLCDVVSDGTSKTQSCVRNILISSCENLKPLQGDGTSDQELSRNGDDAGILTCRHGRRPRTSSCPKEVHLTRGSRGRSKRPTNSRTHRGSSRQEPRPGAAPASVPASTRTHLGPRAPGSCSTR